VSNTVFQIPTGYQEVPASDLIKDLVAKIQAPSKQ
jgi:hypothetical protein